VALLELRDLRVSFRTREGLVHAVNGLSLSLDRGKTLGLVGESGSGKTVTALTTIGLTRSRNTEIAGEVLFDGVDLLRVSDEELRSVRGRRVAMVFQDPLSSLHPMHRVGWQMEEAIRAHRRVSRKVARARAVELLRSVGIPSPQARVDAYPHELSGGMRQRVMIAMALALGPDLLIADEPTSALDVTVQAQILELLATLQEQTGMALILVSHDLGVIAGETDDVAVMYAGRIVEHGPGDVVIGSPLHPYTRGLLGSIPHVDGPRTARLTPIPGSPPSAVRLPSGCAFHPRCPLARASCQRDVPSLSTVGRDHRIACPVVARDPSLISATRAT
jgi:oligopeptide/dipeptide ABC transporter ATP-binding protein